MAISRLSPAGFPAKAVVIPDKQPAGYPAIGLLVSEFDLWREGYAEALIYVYRAGTTTLMPLYSDPGLTQPLTNPQILLKKENAVGKQFGKFAQSVYVPYAYELDIDTVEQTGVQLVPLTTLDGVDASNATVKTINGSTLRQLDDRFDDQVWAEDFGTISMSPATNNVTLAAAISAASIRGGGRVLLPAGTIPFTQLTLPESVILVGQGRGVTILQSQVADEVITITGNSAGFQDITIDGVSLNQGSIGIFGQSKHFIYFTNAEVKRFDVGIQWIGGQNHVYRDLFVRDCVKGIRMLGDENQSGGSNGNEFSGLDWFQGEVSQTTSIGIEMSMVDLPVRHNTFHQIDLLDNVGVDGAVLLTGAAHTKFRQCYWEGNDTHLTIEDNPDSNLTERQVIGLQIEGGQMVDGVVKLDGLCQDVIFDQVQLDGTEFQLNVPVNPILLRDCMESDTLFTGDGTKALRFRTTEHGSVKGLTTDGTQLNVFKIKLAPHEVVQVAVYATAEMVNGNDYADWVKFASFRCAPATLAFDEQTANFTVGSTIIGQTSGATAIIAAQSDGGASGTLSLGSVSGDFVDNELITEDGGSGSARTNGTLVMGSVSTVGSVTATRSAGSDTGAPPSGWALGFSAASQEGLVQITGASATEIAWNLRIDVTAL